MSICQDSVQGICYLLPKYVNKKLYALGFFLLIYWTSIPLKYNWITVSRLWMCVLNCIWNSIWDFISVCSNSLMFSLLITVSLKKNVTMTVKVLGVVKDGSTPYVNNQVHNRTRLLSCAQVCTCLNKTLMQYSFFKSICVHVTLHCKWEECIC